MSPYNETSPFGYLAERWWVFVLRGIAAILFGILTLVWPGISLMALVIVWGAYAILDGIMTLVYARWAGRAGEPWGWLLFEGLVGIVAGVTAFIWPGITALALLVVIAAKAIMSGIAEIVLAVQLRRVVEGEWLLVLSGVLSIAFGALLLVVPGAGALALLWLIAVFAMMLGILLIGLGLRLDRWRRACEGTLHGGTPSHA